MKNESEESITIKLIDFILRTNYSNCFNKNNIPLNESLIEIGILDSYGIIELIEFIESTWDIVIEDDEITKEKMGSINKMTQLIQLKLS